MARDLLPDVVSPIATLLLTEGRDAEQGAQKCSHRQIPSINSSTLSTMPT